MTKKCWWWNNWSNWMRSWMRQKENRSWRYSSPFLLWNEIPRNTNYIFEEREYLKRNISPLCHCERYFCWVLIKRVFCYKFKQVDKPICGHMNTFLLVKTLYQHYSWICGYSNIWIFEFLPLDIWIHGIIRLVLCPPSWQSRQIVGRRQQREMGRS